jgi:D-alanyl-D-alanine carboxypeptidase (penicillin-binding protein 5/6)
MRIFNYCLLFALLIGVFLYPSVAMAKEEVEINLAPNAKSAILMDMDSGNVLYSKNPDQKLPPASITKIMTLLLIMEAIDRGEITLQDKVRTSDYAASMGGSQIFLEAGEEMTVEDLIKGIAIASGNDASVAMAEYLAGTEEAFVEKMNNKAKELGLHNTHFVNCNGLPAPNHYSSARDIAIMSRELLRYENITKYTSIYQDYLRKNSDKPFWLVNTNRLVKFYPGMDGLKTGFTNESKYCLAATAKKGDLRIIGVVMGEPDTKLRNREITQMFDYAFSQYTNHVLYKKGEEVVKVKVDKGVREEIGVVTPHQFGILSKRGESVEKFQKEIIVKEMIKAPVLKGEVVGHLFIKKDGEILSMLNLVASESCEKANFWQTFLKTFRSMTSF